MNQTLFNLLCTIILFEGLIVVILGTLYVIENIIIELFDYDILKGIKERMKDNGNK